MKPWISEPHFKTCTKRKSGAVKQLSRKATDSHVDICRRMRRESTISSILLWLFSLLFGKIEASFWDNSFLIFSCSSSLECLSRRVLWQASNPIIWIGPALIYVSLSSSSKCRKNQRNRKKRSEWDALKPSVIIEGLRKFPAGIMNMRGAGEQEWNTGKKYEKGCKTHQPTQEKYKWERLSEKVKALCATQEINRKTTRRMVIKLGKNKIVSGIRDYGGGLCQALVKGFGNLANTKWNQCYLQREGNQYIVEVD